MSWDAIQAQAAIGAVGAIGGAPADFSLPSLDSPAVQAGSGAEFGQMVSDGISQVNQQLVGAQVDLQRLATGDVQNLHQVMMNLEETRLSFQLLLQVRNRVLEAYQDVMKMQI